MNFIIELGEYRIRKSSDTGKYFLLEELNMIDKTFETMEELIKWIENDLRKAEVYHE